MLAKEDFTAIADDVRGALAEKHEENKNHKTVEIFSDDQVSLVSQNIIYVRYVN